MIAPLNFVAMTLKSSFMSLGIILGLEISGIRSFQLKSELVFILVPFKNGCFIIFKIILLLNWVELIGLTFLR